MKAERNRQARPGTVQASGFQAKCRELVDEAAERGEELVITRNGRPVSRLAPCPTSPGLVFGRHRDNIRILGDIVSPMPAEWYEKADDADEDLP